MTKDFESEARALLAKSGNAFHTKVLRYFRAKGWTVLVSPYYTDGVTDKPRELDLVVEKAYPIGDLSETLNVKLYIECKYINATSLIWFDAKTETSIRSWISTHHPLRDKQLYFAHHHLSGDKAAGKLFDDGRKGNESDGVFPRAINQVLNGFVFHSQTGSIIPSDQIQRPIFDTIHYPVLVVSGLDRLFRVDVTSPSDLKDIADNFQLEVEYAYLDAERKSQIDFFMIDVVAIEQLDAFIKVLEDEIAWTSRSLSS